MIVIVFTFSFWLIVFKYDCPFGARFVMKMHVVLLAANFVRHFDVALALFRTLLP